MPKVPGGAVDRQSRRHNPLAEEYAPSDSIRQKTPKRKRTANEDATAKGDNFVDAKASRRILQIGQDLIEEDEAERKKALPNPAFDLGSRFAFREDQPDADPSTYIHGDEGDEEDWGSDGSEIIEEEIEIDPNDQDIFNRFHPSNADSLVDPSRLLSSTRLSGTAPPITHNEDDDDAEQQSGTNLADLILAKIAEHEAAGGEPTSFDDRPASPGFDEGPVELPPKVVEVYTKVGQLLSRHRSGPLPKPFKIIPTLPEHQIPLVIDLTGPEQWTPHAFFLATKLFISSRPTVAQPFLRELLLPKVRDEIQETKKLHVHLYNALKKALYKPACFFKGILFPLLEDGTCTLREAHIISSVVARVSVPVLHSAAALLRLCDIAAEQFSTRRDDGGGAATNTFIRMLLEKKYALPYKVVDALVFHFLRFKALAGVVDDDDDTEMHGAAARRDRTAARLPVVWHQGLLAFAQRYRNEITEDQREALLDLINAVGHRQMGPETRRELLEGRGRGIPAEGADAMMADGGDDTMVTI